MAGGVNPFGFTAGIIPAPRAPRQPQDLPSAPFGFAPPPSKMQQTLAILNEYNPLPAFERLMNSPMALGGPISEQDIADGLMVSGSVMGGSAAAPKPRNALNMGIRAYHGSPHDFDRFDMSKIGTGEGAQAYGHGLYFAGNEDIARHYRQALSGAPTVQYKGDDYALPAALSELKKWRTANPEGSAYLEGLRKKTMEDAAKILLENVGGGSDAPGVLRNLVNSFPSAAQDTAKGWVEQAEKLIKPHLAVNEPGHMYEVEINADPDAFLDWDKPLSADAPQAVKDAFNKIANSDPVLKEKFHQAFRDQQPGNIYYSILNDHARTGDLVKNQTFATEKLKEAGIPGIKYLDAGSRAAGDGSRNYVVFDQNLISIVRKYGIAGASAMLGYNILDGMDPAQADELKRIEGNQ